MRRAPAQTTSAHCGDIFSRANSQWRELSETTDALAIFAGPHHYISTEWYPGTYEDGKEVPTWNYAVVHAYGPVRVIHDAAWLLAHVSTLTDEHEAGMPRPWKVGDAPPDFIASQLQGIVGLEIPIRRLEGKWKASQNRTQAEREGVIAGLKKLDAPESLAISEMVSKAAQNLVCAAPHLTKRRSGTQRARRLR